MTSSPVTPCAVELRPNCDLGRTRAGGLRGVHHFCFASYQQPDRMEWGELRCLNLYQLHAGAAREPSFHAGFDILCLVTAGAVRRTGTFASPHPLQAGSVELICTGTGAMLGLEAVGTEQACYTETWIRAEPVPGDAHREWRSAVDAGFDVPLASGPRGPSRCLRLSGDAQVRAGSLGEGEAAALNLARGECAYLAVLRGRISANGIVAGDGDGLAASPPGQLSIVAGTRSELLLVQTTASSFPG